MVIVSYGPGEYDDCEMVRHSITDEVIDRADALCEVFSLLFI